MVQYNVLMDIDEVELGSNVGSNGVYKYILIELTDRVSGKKKMIMRTHRYCHCHSHVDILEEFQEKHESLNIKSKCVGGGRVTCRFDQQRIYLFEEFVVIFGKDEQKIAKGILQKEYPNFTISEIESPQE